MSSGIQSLAAALDALIAHGSAGFSLTCASGRSTSTGWLDFRARRGRWTILGGPLPAEIVWAVDVLFARDDGDGEWLALRHARFRGRPSDGDPFGVVRVAKLATAVMDEGIRAGRRYYRAKLTETAVEQMFPHELHQYQGFRPAPPPGERFPVSLVARDHGQGCVQYLRYSTNHPDTGDWVALEFDALGSREQIAEPGNYELIDLESFPG